MIRKTNKNEQVAAKNRGIESQEQILCFVSLVPAPRCFMHQLLRMVQYSKVQWGAVWYGTVEYNGALYAPITQYKHAASPSRHHTYCGGAIMLHKKVQKKYWEDIIEKNNAHTLFGRVGAWAQRVPVLGA